MNRLLVSYLTLRRIIGLLGMALPLILLYGHRGFEPSISEYYATNVGNVLVGVLFVIGFFLFAYKGYDKVDDLLGDVCFISALGVALFPATSALKWVQTVHMSSATLLFSSLAIFTGFLFTKGHLYPTKEKLIRNRVYRICSLVIVACITALAVYLNSGQASGLTQFKPVFWLETLALWAFGVSWFIKGETLWKDA